MANPWHDETGKFCGKEEMRAAVDRLAASGNLDGYFTLRQDFDLIDQKKSIVSDALLEKLAKSGLSLQGGPKPLTAEADIREIYKTIRDELSKPKGNQSQSFARLLEYQNLPKDIRDEILTKGNLELKNKLLYEGIEERHPMLGTDILKIVKGETDPSLIAKAVATRKLTFEDRYRISAQSERGLFDLAEQNSKIFFSEPGLEDELYNKTKTLLASNPDEAQQYLSLLAICSGSQRTHSLIVEKGNLEIKYGSPYYHLSGNKHLTLDSMVIMSQHMVKENVLESGALSQQLAQRQAGIKQDQLRMAIRTASSQENTPYKGNAGANISLAQELAELNAKKIMTNNGLTFTETRRRQSLQAGWDSYSDTFKALKKEAGKSSRSDKTPEGAQARKDTAARLALARAHLAGNAFISSLKWQIEN